MTDADFQSPAPGIGPAPYKAVLTPHRSLSRRGFYIMMGVLAGVSFAEGIAFTLIGAWPIFGFFGLDVLGVWIAFRLSERSGRAYETVELTDGRLTVTHVDPRGRAQAWQFEPYWVRVELAGEVETGVELALASHGRRLVFARFLSHHEKLGLARRLEEALRPYRAA